MMCLSCFDVLGLLSGSWDWRFRDCLSEKLDLFECFFYHTRLVFYSFMAVLTNKVAEEVWNLWNGFLYVEVLDVVFLLEI